MMDHLIKELSLLAQPEDDPKEYQAALKTIQQECSKKKKNTGKFIQNIIL